MKFVIKLFTGIFVCLMVLIIGQTILSFSNTPWAYKTFLVQSGSMSPTINTGDLIFVKSINYYQTGDIVTFTDTNNKKVTHRISQVNFESSKNIYHTKGDANTVIDNDTITDNQIIGKVFFHLPFLGYLITFSKTLPGIIIFIVIPSTVIIYDEIRKILKQFQQKKSL